MQTSNANQSFSSGDPIWILLSELSLSDFLPDQERRDGPAAGFLFQSLRELGMSPEGMENIARMLAGFAKEGSVRTKQGRLEFPGRVRIFCQKKLVENANIAKLSRPSPPEQAMKPAQVFPDARTNRIGGWGYFSIERGGNVSTRPSLRAGNSVDLYLYKEGE